MSSSNTRTKWRIRIIGHGVVPSYVLKPKFRVARFEAVGNEAVELKISVSSLIITNISKMIII